MGGPAQILVIAATARELAPPDGWRTLCCGVGPVEAAAQTAAELATRPPTAILHIGIAGARRRAGLAPGTVVIGSEAFYCDLTVPAAFASTPRSLSPAPHLLARAQRALPDAAVLRIGTSARVGGSDDCDVEAMEGFAVLRAAALAGIPAIEVRVISNEIEERDRARWEFARALEGIATITPQLIVAFERVQGDA